MNSWTYWILLSAVMLALYDLAKKASVRANAVLPVLLISTLCGAAAYVLALALFGNLSAACAAAPRVILLGLAKSCIVGTSWVFTFQALRTLPVSIATPIRASSPALVFVIAFFLYGEIPTLLQALGMLAVFAGYGAFSWAGRHEGIDFLRNRAVWCALAGAFFSAVSSLFDKFVFQYAAAPVPVVQLYFQLGLVLFYGTLLGGRTLLKLPHDPFSWRLTIPLVGILLAGADFLYFTGLALPDTPISLAALVRRVSVVITFVLGARVFHETNLKRKSLALTVLLLGVLLICLG